MQNNWILFTGGPNSGKTTVIELLASLGYNVKVEQAMKVIHEYMNAGIPLSSVQTDPVQGAKFQDAIALQEMAAAAENTPNELVFLDRGAIEYFAFSKLRGLAINPEIAQKVRQSTYRHVFVFDLIESSFAANKIEAHIDNPLEAARNQQSLIEDVVAEFGFPTTRVPVMKTEERIKLIFDTLQLPNPL